MKLVECYCHSDYGVDDETVLEHVGLCAEASVPERCTNHNQTNTGLEPHFNHHQASILFHLARLFSNHL